MLTNARIRVEYGDVTGGEEPEYDRLHPPQRPHLCGRVLRRRLPRPLLQRPELLRQPPGLRGLPPYTEDILQYWGGVLTIQRTTSKTERRSSLQRGQSLVLRGCPLYTEGSLEDWEAVLSIQRTTSRTERLSSLHRGQPPGLIGCPLFIANMIGKHIVWPSENLGKFTFFTSII